MNRSKLLLAAMAMLPLFCSCGSKTQNVGSDGDSAVVLTGNADSALTDGGNGNATAGASDAKNSTELVIDKTGVENLRLGMKRSQVLKSVPGLYDSYIESENELDGYVELIFEGKNGTITAILDVEDAIESLAFNVHKAVTSDGKLKIGMKLSDVIASGSYQFVRYGFGLIEVHAKGSNFSFELPADAFTKATENIFDAREGEDVILTATPDMVKPSAKLETIVVF